MKTIKYTLPIAYNKDSKFLVISDIHIGLVKKASILTEIIAEIESSNSAYDAIFFLGDLIDSTEVLEDQYQRGQILNFLRKLNSLAPLFIVKGNHDLSSLKKNGKAKLWKIDEEKYEEKILDLLSNDKKTIYTKTGSYQLNDNMFINIYNPQVEYIRCPQQSREQILKEDYDTYKFLTKLDSNKTNILLCHYPDVLKWFHKEGLLENVDLAIAGHNHGGMTQNILMESLLKLLKQNNRGLITPEKSLKLIDTKEIRGIIRLSDRTTLYINPAITSLAPNTGLLNRFNFLFYKGMTEINLSKNKNKEKIKNVEK